MTKRILVIGKTGQLGRSIEKISLNYKELDFILVGRNEIDLSSTASIRSFFKKENAFDVIINAAAYTNVEQAEKDFEIANAVNHIAVAEIAKQAKLQQTFLIHVSTDYVFDGKGSSPYVEEDSLRPLNNYGKTKFLGEQAILASGCAGVIVRTGWLYSEFGNNFVKTILRLGQQRDEINVVSDQIGSPTYALDLARVLVLLAQPDVQRGIEIFHYSNEGVCSWYELAQAVFNMSNMQTQVVPIQSKDYATQAVRPYYSVLNKDKIRHQLDIGIPHWRDSLQRCLYSLGQCLDG